MVGWSGASLSEAAACEQTVLMTSRINTNKAFQKNKEIIIYLITFEKGLLLQLGCAHHEYFTIVCIVIVKIQIPLDMMSLSSLS